MGSTAKKRILDYYQTLETFKHMPKEQKLIRVNAYLNRLLPQVDQLNQQQLDYWESPKEFLTLGYGDCEDYAIIKYYTLIKLGFDPNKLYMTTVKDKYTGGYHMVLSYFKDKKKPPLILDNLSFKILPLDKRTDLEVDLLLNPKGTYTIKKVNGICEFKRSNKKLIQYDELLKKVKENR